MKRINIQIRGNNEKSKSLTINAPSIEYAYSKINFLFDSLEQVDDVAELRFYK